MTRPAFCRIPRLNGEPALVRADQITALLPQRVKSRGSDEMADEVVIQLGTVVIHTPLTVDQIAMMVLNATGQPMVIQEPPAA